MKNLSLNQMWGFLFSQITHFKYLYVSGKSTGNVCLTFAILKQEFRWWRTFMVSLRGSSLTASIFVVNFPMLWGLCRLVQFCTTSLLIGVMLSQPILIPITRILEQTVDWINLVLPKLMNYSSRMFWTQETGVSRVWMSERTGGSPGIINHPSCDEWWVMATHPSECRDVAQISSWNVMYNF